MSAWKPGQPPPDADRRGMLTLLGPYRRPFSVAVCLGTASQATNIAATVVAASVVARAIAGATVNDLTGSLWLLAGLVVARAAAHWGEGWVSHELAFRILAEIRTWQYRAFERLAPAKLIHRRSGDLVARAMSDAQAMEMLYAHTLIYVFAAAAVTPLTLATTVMIHPAITAAVTPWLVACAAAPWWLRKRNRQHGTALRESLAAINTTVTDQVGGLGELLAFAHTEQARATIHDTTRQAVAAQQRQGRREGIELTLANALAAAGTLTTLLVGAYLVADGTISTISLPPAVMLAAGTFAPILTLLGATRVWGVTTAASKRVFELLDEPAAVPDHGTASPSGRYDLDIAGVTFAYPGASQPALYDISCRIEHGETIALVGRSGAGKTTLANLIARFYDPDHGTIRIGGTDLRELSLEDLYRTVGYIPQNVFLFNTTLAENLLLGAPTSSEQQLREAIAAAQLTDVVLQLPQGLATAVGSNGAQLSGGERQRVAIARALLHNAPILILDEAVSMLDPTAEHALNKAINTIRTSRTTIIIAHRLSTVLAADRIAIIDHGRLIDTGTHHDLIERCSPYRELVQPQLAATASFHRHTGSPPHH